MRKKSIKRSTCAVLAAALTTAGLALPPKTTQISAADTVLKYEFEDGSVSGGKIYSEGWIGNTQEDGSGEEMDLTNFSGNGFSYLDQKGTTVSVEVDVPVES